ncbi:hypothetical protein [Nonomuraea longicatena]
MIATLMFGSIGTSHASPIPTSASAGDSHVAAIPNAAPPVCRSFYKDEKPFCSEGYADGFEAGRACGPPRQTGRVSSDEAYDIGYAAGYTSGKRTCKS